MNHKTILQSSVKVSTPIYNRQYSHFTGLSTLLMPVGKIMFLGLCEKPAGWGHFDPQGDYVPEWGSHDSKDFPDSCQMALLGWQDPEHAAPAGLDMEVILVAEGQMESVICETNLCLFYILM